MKLPKRILALLLAFMLALGLGASVIAEDEPPGEPNPAMPVITAQPQSITIQNNSEFSISVQAEIPNGDPMRYEWFSVESGMTVSDETSITGGISVQFAKNAANAQFQYYVVVYNANDESLYVTSETATLTVTREPASPSFFQRAGSVLGSIFFGIPMFILVWGGFFGVFGFFALFSFPIMLLQGVVDLFR